MPYAEMAEVKPVSKRSEDQVAQVHKAWSSDLLLQIDIRMSLALCKFDEIIVENRNGFRVYIGMKQQALSYEVVVQYQSYTAICVVNNSERGNASGM